MPTPPPTTAWSTQTPQTTSWHDTIDQTLDTWDTTITDTWDSATDTWDSLPTEGGANDPKNTVWQTIAPPTTIWA